MATRPILDNRSSLARHRFPPFYACYLLKSVRTPKATATYIGSTPHPPRRIRQHNGEISQGAWKTQHNRPWVMQMIVHGFPSKLAALQFEWAWQHPHISRHLRDEGGKNTLSGGRYLKANVAIARTMVASHPYTSWPLRVTLFTEDAVKAWKDATNKLDRDGLPLPPGFTHTVELEGVNGRSGHPGSGRTEAIDVADANFTKMCLDKHNMLLSSTTAPLCSVCAQRIDDYAIEPLSSAVCPSRQCTATSHILCLSSHFLSQIDDDAGIPAMIPRGGTCPQCELYVLWGDVIRGCYRREAGITTSAMDVDDEPTDDPCVIGGPAGGSATEHQARDAPPKQRIRQRLQLQLEEEGEYFDLDAVDTTDDEASKEAATRRLGPDSRRAPVGGSTTMRVTRRTPDKMAKRTTSKRRYHTTRSVIDESYSDNVDSGTTAPVSGLGSHLATPFAPKNAVKIPYPQRAPGVVDRAEGEQRCTSAPEVASQRANSIRSSPHHTPPRQTGRTFQDEEYGLYASDTSPSDPKFSHTFSVLSISSPSNSPLGARDVIELSD